MLEILLKIMFWFFLTANFSLINIFLGLSIALLLPNTSTSPPRPKELFSAIGKIIFAFFQAYKEAFELILYPHLQEEVLIEQIQGTRSPWRIFLNIFLITFTPKTTVLKFHEDGWFEVHYVKRRQK